MVYFVLNRAHAGMPIFHIPGNYGPDTGSWHRLHHRWHRLTVYADVRAPLVEFAKALALEVIREA